MMNRLFTFMNSRKCLECRTVGTRISADGKDVPKKPNVENRITLIGTDDSVSITDLRNAHNLSTRRELKLVKIQDIDSKTRRPVYKLMTNAQYHEEELSKRKEKFSLAQSNVLKGQKLMTFSARIADHDLLTNVKKIGKLLEKQYEIKIVVSGDENEQTKLEKIVTIIEKNLKTVGKIVQMRTKGNNLRFNLIPNRNDSDQAQNNSDSSKNDSDKGPL